MDPSFHITRVGILKLFIILSGLATSYLLAGDGPQNTGRLRIKPLNDREIEAVLQVDKKVFLNPKELFNTILITNKNQVCQSSAPNMVLGEDTLSASCIFKCNDSIGLVGLELRGTDTLPIGFSMGIQTPFDHFSLTKDLPAKTTQLSVRHAFFFSGFSLGFIKTLPIGRPYAFSFGGLEDLPWGIWWFLLLGALGVCCLKKKIKLLLMGISLPLSASVAYFLLAREASLLFITVPNLELSYLILIFAMVALSFMERFYGSQLASIFLTLALLVAMGFELAIILRWVEGNPQIPLNESLSSFFLGLFAMSLLVVTTILWISHSLTGPEQMKKLARITLLCFTFYTGVVLLFQL